MYFYNIISLQNVKVKQKKPGIDEILRLRFASLRMTRMVDGIISKESPPLFCHSAQPSAQSERP